jgi:DNA invertase Pin-like site-specific DNA recombinase
VQDVLVAFAGWMVGREPARRSERIKAGLAKRAAQGKQAGQQPGGKDTRVRKRGGCVAAWEQGGARPEAADRRGGQA